MARLESPNARRTPLQRKLDIFYPLDKTEDAAVVSLGSGLKLFPSGTTILEEGAKLDRVYIVQRGWAMRYKSLENGRRQVLSFVLPGDFIALEATLFTESDCSASALTDLEVVEIDPVNLLKVLGQYPQVALAIAWCAAREQSLISEHFVSAGRRNAYEALAHLLVELWRRLQILGINDNHGYHLPVTQAVIADALGLSQVHVNRTMKRLQRDNLIEFNTHAVRAIAILDMAGLEAAAGFQDGYLHFTEMPFTTRKFLTPNGS